MITSRTTGGAELVPDDGGFLMEDPDDRAGLVSIFRGICRDGSRLPGMSASSRKRALTLGWDRMGRRYLEILEAS